MLSSHAFRISPRMRLREWKENGEPNQGSFQAEEWLMTWHLKDVVITEKKWPFCLGAKSLDPIKTKTMYVNSEKKFLNSQFCNPR